MDYSNHNLETVETCKSVIDNAGKMSFETTEVSLTINNNKDYSEIIDDSMVCDDDDNCIDVRKDEVNQSITVELPPVAVTEEIPPKYDPSCSEVLGTFASPKSKKRKLSSFNELVENLHSNILAMNFTKLLLFLESNNKEVIFPIIVKENEDFFEMIVQDINILKSKSLDANYRDICDKIIGAATGYLLTCVYEYRQNFQKIVLVINKEHMMDQSKNGINKEHMMDQSENGTSSFSCSRQSVMPSSQTSSKVDNTEMLSSSQSPGLISSGFKIHCLRTTLAFVKNDIVKTKEFPELNLEQAQFMNLLLESVIAFTEFDSNLEIKELYRALWEAVRIYSLKYEFRIKCVESYGGKKSLVFEKIPKQKPPATAVNSNKIMNLKTDVLKTEESRPEASQPEATITESSKPGTPKPEASKTDASEDSKSDASEYSKSETPNPEASKTDAPEDSKSEAPKPEASKQEAPKPEASKTDALEDSKSEAPKPEASKPEALKPEAPKPEALKPEASKSEPQNTEASKSQPWFTMPEIPKLEPCVNQKPTHVTKRMLKRRLKMENENLFIKRLPAKFISDTLNTIHEFLLDEEKFKLVFVPNTHSELEFYKKCLTWCRATFVVSKFGVEFQDMHYQISCLLSRVSCTVNKSITRKINETTGMKEVTYIKTRKNVPLVSIPDTAHSAPKKKKLNLQNALQLAGTDNIKLASVINLNQSLRNKKKNKKLKKAKSKANNSAGASKETSVKPTNRTKTWTDGSSSTCSSRGTSRDRSKAAARAQRLAKAMNEIKRETSRNRRGEQTIRKEQLIEALSVPVQSDKAMRIMRGMGWSGGALGARGNGITEPLMPTLDIARGAGLGHSRNAQSEKIPRKPRKPKTAPSFVSNNSNETTETENDVIVQKTKQLLLENPTFDSIIKLMEPQKSKASNVELPKPTKSTILLEKLKVELPPQTKSLPAQTKTTVELPKPIKTNVEPPKPTTSSAKKRLKPLPTLTKFSIALQKPEHSDLEFPLPFRQEILHSILELLNSDATCKTLKYENKITKKGRNFVQNAVKLLKNSINYGIFQKDEYDICRQIQVICKNQPQVVLDALISYDFKTVELIKKVVTEFETPTQQELPITTLLSLRANTEIISDKDLYSYIISSGSHYETEKAYEVLKFKVLFLLNILSFVKSSNEEVEVTFNQILNVKQKAYIENVVDEVNMRIKFGSSPAETKLFAEIKNHVKDAFLGCMFNHQYTVVTLNKYFRFKRLNRPDNAVKRTCQTTFNLHAFSSETFSKAKLNTNEPTDKENNSKVAENKNEVAESNNKDAENNIEVENNKMVTENNSKVAEYNNAYVAYENNVVASGSSTKVEEPESNELEPYDSDKSCDEEYNNNNCSVPKLLQGEDGVNISNFLYLYDEEKINTAGFKDNSNINNDSASKNNSNVTENRNKNNIDNGYEVIDNNDMKRDDGYTKKEKNIVDTKMTDNVLCVDYTEEVVNSGEMTVEINKENDVNISENNKDSEEIDQTIKRSDIVVANVVEIVNQHKEIGIGNIDKMIEVLSNAEDTIDQNVIVIEDSDSSNDCTETIVKDETQNDGNLSKNYKDIKEDTDVIMIEIDDEPMEEIRITEESIEVIDKENLVKVINKEVSVELINRAELMEEINKVESSGDVEVAIMEEENGINPNNNQIVKGDLNIKTDGNIISKEKLVLSKDICDTHSLGLSRVNTIATTVVPNFHINKDTEIKNVRIVHRNHPIRKLDNEEVEAIQKHISNRIVRATELPLFKCHGVQNGALIYTCHNKKTYDWLQNINIDASYVEVLNTEVTKMALKFYCFFDFNTKEFFRMIELYNRELSTKDWVVEKTEKNDDYVIFIVRMDKFSVKFIQESGFALFAGIDKVEFNLIWE